MPKVTATANFAGKVVAVDAKPAVRRLSPRDGKRSIDATGAQRCFQSQALVALVTVALDTAARAILRVRLRSSRKCWPSALLGLKPAARKLCPRTAGVQPLPTGAYLFSLRHRSHSHYRRFGTAARAILRVRLRSSRKCWPSALRGLKPATRRLAQGRQALNRRAQGRRGVSGLRHWLHWSLYSLGHRASRLASRSAAIKELGSARPWPAMSNAVPWSGLVRTNGRPSVRLTARSKASVLIGMSA